jgi:hypothetical protein
MHTMCSSIHVLEMSGGKQGTAAGCRHNSTVTTQQTKQVEACTLATQEGQGTNTTFYGIDSTSRPLSVTFGLGGEGNLKEGWVSPPVQEGH